jgi:hypothetical protein
MRKFWFSVATDTPSNVVWQWQTQVSVLDEDTAKLQRYMTVTSPPLNVTGQDASKYIAGTGLRIDWLTSTVSGRRMMRAANYLIPLTSAAFTSQGAVSAAIATAVTTAAGVCLNDLDTANLALVAYHRPPKGTFSGGHSGVVTSYRVPIQGSTLRSRRT